MQNRYYLYQRRSTGIYFIQDRLAKKHESLRTRDTAVAQRLFNAKNQAAEQPMLNVSLAKVYLSGTSPEMATRTWYDVMHAMEQGYQDETLRLKHPPQCANGNGVEVGTKGDALCTRIQHHATNEFLPCLLGEEAETLKVVGGWTGRFFNFNSNEMTVRIFQDKINLLLMLCPIMKEGRPGPAPAGLLEQFDGDEILQNGPGHEAILFQAVSIETHEVAKQPGII